MNSVFHPCSPHGDGDPLLRRTVAALMLTLLGRASSAVAADCEVAGVDEVLEGGEALGEVALEGVVRQQAQRRQAVDAPRSLKRGRTIENYRVADSNQKVF